MRPKSEEIAEAQAHFERLIRLGCLTEDDIQYARTLIAATEPAKDEAIALFASKLYSLVGTPNSAEALLARIQSKEPIGALGIVDIVFATARHFLGSPKP